MSINDKLTLGLKVRQLNEILLDVRAYKEAHPEERCGYYTQNFGSLLNAYREGDISFEEAVRLMQEVATSARREALNEARQLVAAKGCNYAAHLLHEHARALSDLPPENWQGHTAQDFGRTEDAACPKCGEAAGWRDIEGHADGGEYFCPLGCEVPKSDGARVQS